MNKRNLILLILAMLGSAFLNAQIPKGKTLIGLSSTLSIAGTGSDLMQLGFSKVQSKSDASGYVAPDPDKRTSFNLLPKAGYFFIDNLAAGFDLSFALSIDKDGEGYAKSTQTLLSIGPFIRYYIPSSKVLPFFEISSSFGSINYKTDYKDNTYIVDSEYKSSLTSLGGGIGFSAPLGKKVNFDILALYNSLTIKDKEDNPDNYRTIIGTFGLELGFTIMLGSNNTD